jgi:hypothetical protein
MARKAKSLGAISIAEIDSEEDGKRPPLFFHCPRTGLSAPAGIGTDVATLRRFWHRKLEVDCPHCGEVHRFSVRETFLSGALTDFTDRPNPLATPSQTTSEAAA